MYFSIENAKECLYEVYRSMREMDNAERNLLICLQRVSGKKTKEIAKAHKMSSSHVSLCYTRICNMVYYALQYSGTGYHEMFTKKTKSGNMAVNFERFWSPEGEEIFSYLLFLVKAKGDGRRESMPLRLKYGRDRYPANEGVAA